MADRVLVTGGSGFIGKALITTLEQSGFDPISLGTQDGDIAVMDLSAHLAGENITRVVHLAGRTFVPQSWSDPLAFYRTNVLGTANVADYCRKVGAQLTYVSAYIYGSPEVLPISEDSVARPNNPYAQSKFLGEQICRQFAETFSVPTTILRPFNIYGPGQSSAFLIPKIIDQVMNAPTITLDCLSPRRDYIYIEDLVHAIIASFDQSGQCDTFNLGSGTSISVSEVIDIIQAKAKTNKPVISQNVIRENEIMDVVADISKFRSAFGWRPKFDFAEGIEAIVAKYSDTPYRH